MTTAFEAEYRRKFARSPPDVALEFIAARIAMRTPARHSALAATTSQGGPTAAIKARRPAWFAEADGFLDTPVYDRARLGTGDHFPGPALVEDPGSTLVIGPAAHCKVTQSGSIIVDLKKSP